ncbi:Ig-like domain-containing protein [Tamlana sp. 2_MG-2023]|uniref:Ig-like domain-containing protein n=1 Tax=unclassified Tamlana TaxID=2614803 RepID=UPI0026E1F6C1|nr:MULTISPECIES: Ig-like domain-containing protein [unclassified Tamlana]MDO6759930.1 Ig-like domain-containing protein [Tamlana sp. 2_MG-2023]MDO6791900.1 Ig-like domain-containing protein [Tamlana sp. 1_MG-2023]
MKLNSFLFSLLLCLSFFNAAFAAPPDYWQGKGRIAVSSDGNMHDNDDMQATMMTLMILAKAHLQPNTVLYTYADHVWGSEGNDLALMKESAEGGGQRFGFQNTNFIAAVTNPEAAYNAMRDEILKSTANDPLFIIGAGPMHVIGTGIQRANAINPNALNHVTVISHSNWNNRHADNPEDGSVHGWESPHSGWTWDEMVSSFGSKVNFNYISDQNGTGPNPYASKDKFSAPNWASWGWMNTHQDPNIKWVYTRGVSNPAGPDYSDAGMAYYFCADLNGVRGDEFGNPEKLRQWVGTDVIDVVVDNTKVWGVSVQPTSFTINNVNGTRQLTATINPTTAVNKNVTWSSDNISVATVSASGLVKGVGNGNAKITVTTADGGKIATANVTVGSVGAGETTVCDDFIAIEADATNSSLGAWQVRKPGDAGYDAIAGSLAPINNTYIEYTGGVIDGLGVAAGQDVLVYKFTPQTSGNYRLTGRMAQRLTHNGSKAAWDQANDIFVKMEGDFTSGNATPMNILTNWTKFYGRGKDIWGAFIQGDVNHAKYQLIYNLKAGVEYTMSISGRSQRVCIDYFLLSKTSLTIAEDKDLATNNDARFRPGNPDCTITTPPSSGDVCETINSVDFDKYTNMGTGFTNATVDGTRGVLQMPTRLAWGAAQETYTGPNAEVYVTLNTMQETDGESSYKVFIDGVLIKEVTNDRIFGTAISDYTIQSHKLNDTKVSISTGDIIRVEFNSATNGEVSEGNTTATSRGRWKSIELCSSGDDSGDGNTNTEPVIISHTAPSNVDVGVNEVTFTVNYSSPQVVDFVATIHCTSTNNSTEGFKRINGISSSGNGSFQITVPISNTLDSAKEYRWVLYFLPVGGTWQNQYEPLHMPFVPFSTNKSLSVNTTKVDNKIDVYPTVFSNVFTIKSNLSKITKAEVFSINGARVLEKSINQENEVHIESAKLRSGFYLLRVQFSNGYSVTRKIIKK